ncbi:MAG: Uncharacterised protein [Owenweeksia sp. TMED14]|nr:MAG: Uncharacterised protein [Owenweeksia sp. TMED14]|tara:strand:+ start:1512 stop:1745 length:234 start_codon:yes stop_codon:yes gene_type:complete
MRRIKKELFFKKRKFNNAGDLIQKICNNCKNWKPVSKFTETKSLMDGYENDCHECFSDKPRVNKYIGLDGFTNKNGF